MGRDGTNGNPVVGAQAVERREQITGAILYDEDNKTGIFMMRASFVYFGDTDIFKLRPEDGSVDESPRLRIDAKLVLSEPRQREVSIDSLSGYEDQWLIQTTRAIL
jgi:hypothetical protein